MGIKVMAYNTLDGFGDELRVDRLLALIREEAPNLAFFSEAYEASRDMESVKLKLNRMGYEVVLAPYDDDDERSDRHGFIAITNYQNNLVTRRYGTRMGVGGGVAVNTRRHSTLALIGLHMDDRTEARRLAQVATIPPIDGPTVMMGDLNAMHASTFVARLGRLAHPLARILPRRDPISISEKQPLVYKAGSLMYRSSEMSQGRTLRALRERDLRDADPTHQPTIHGMFQLDHFLISREVTASRVTVMSHITLSDHKPITAVLEVR